MRGSGGCRAPCRSPSGEGSYSSFPATARSRIFTFRAEWQPGTEALFTERTELPPLLDAERIAIRYGHFYAYRLVERMGLMERDGVVRVSMAHYNAPEEVARLIEALDAAI